jgi:hypothetical protein
MKSWGSGGIAAAFLTTALNEGEWSASSLGGFTATEVASGAQYIGAYASSPPYVFMALPLIA